MKMRTFLLIFLSIILINFLFAQNPPNIDSTRSISATTLVAIHDALYNDQFLSQITPGLAFKDEVEELIENVGGTRSESWDFFTYRAKTFEFVFGIINETQWINGHPRNKENIINFPVSETKIIDRHLGV